MRTTCPGPFDPTTRRAPSPWRTVKPLVASAVLAFGGTSWGADISEIYAEAVANDPVLARARFSHEITKTSVTTARANLLPQITANARQSTGTQSVDSINMNPNSPDFGRPTPDREFTSQGWGAGLSQQVLNVGSWFGYRGAKADANRADWDLQTASQGLIIRVAQAYLNVLSRQAELESAIAAEEAVQRQLEQVQQRFDVGARSNHRRPRVQGRIRQRGRHAHSGGEPAAGFLRSPAHPDRHRIRRDCQPQGRPCHRRSAAQGRGRVGAHRHGDELRHPFRPTGAGISGTQRQEQHVAVPADLECLGQLRDQQRPIEHQTESSFRTREHRLQSATGSTSKCPCF